MSRVRLVPVPSALYPVFDIAIADTWRQPRDDEDDEGFKWETIGVVTAEPTGPRGMATETLWSVYVRNTVLPHVSGQGLFGGRYSRLVDAVEAAGALWEMRPNGYGWRFGE